MIARVEVTTHAEQTRPSQRHAVQLSSYDNAKFEPQIEPHWRLFQIFDGRREASVADFFFCWVLQSPIKDQLLERFICLFVTSPPTCWKPRHAGTTLDI